MDASQDPKPEQAPVEEQHEEAKQSSNHGILGDTDMLRDYILPQLDVKDLAKL